MRTVSNATSQLSCCWHGGYSRFKGEDEEGALTAIIVLLVSRHLHSLNFALSRQDFRRLQLIRSNLRSVYQGLRQRRPTGPEGAVGENPLCSIDP